MTANEKAMEYRKPLERDELDPHRTAATGAGMWAWMLQRGSALALIVLVALHLARTYNRPVQFLLLLIIAFHAALGLRVILLDFNLVSVKYHRWLIWGLLGVATAIALIVWFAIY
jgi:succinate dehydrogenase / fumarate reductase cytochrome b subunit